MDCTHIATPDPKIKLEPQENKPLPNPDTQKPPSESSFPAQLLSQLTSKKLDNQDILKLLSGMSTSALAKVVGARDSNTLSNGTASSKRVNDNNRGNKSSPTPSLSESVATKASRRGSGSINMDQNGTSKAHAIENTKPARRSSQTLEAKVKEEPRAPNGPRNVNGDNRHTVDSEHPNTIKAPRDRTTSPSPASNGRTRVTSRDGNPPSTGDRHGSIAERQGSIALNESPKRGNKVNTASVPPPQDGRHTVRPPPFPPLPVVDVAYEVHVALLKQVEREYNEGKAELFEIEAQCTEVVQNMDRLSRDVHDLTQALEAKKAALDRCRKDKNELEGMIKYSKRQLALKKEVWNVGKEKGEEMRRRSAAVPLGGPLQPGPAHIPPADPRAAGPNLERKKSVLGGLEQRRDEVLLIPERERFDTIASSAEKRSRSIDEDRGDLLTLAKAGGGSLVDPRMGPSLHSRQTSGTREICFEYNRAECRHASCARRHVCVACNGSHPFYVCTAKRTSCFRFNNEECGPQCHREHRCLRCASGEHRWLECHIPPAPENGIEYCLTWNSSQNCHSGPNCERRHQCLRCRGSHAVIICPENVPNYFETYDGRFMPTMPGPMLGTHIHPSSLASMPPLMTMGQYDRPIIPYYEREAGVHEAKRLRLE